MIPKDKIKEIVFAKYADYIKLASNQHGYIRRIGLHPDELVNEAIIGIIDCKIQFDSEKEIDDFIIKAISSIAYFENTQVGKKDSMLPQEIKDENLNIENNDEAPFEYSDSAYAQKSEDLYDIFYNYRFPEGIECPNCGCKSTTAHPAGWQCKICMTAISLKSRTYLHHKPWPFVKIYRALEILLINPDIMGMELAIKIGVGTDKAVNMLTLFRKVSLKINNNDPIAVIKKLLTPIKFDEDKVTIHQVSYTHFNLTKIEAVRQEYLDGASMKSLVLKYNKNKSRIFNIITGKNSGRHTALSEKCREQYLKNLASIRETNKRKKYSFNKNCMIPIYRKVTLKTFNKLHLKIDKLLKLSERCGL